MKIGSMTWRRLKLLKPAAWIILAAILAAVSGCGGVKPVLQSVIVRDTIVVTEARYLIDTLELYKDTVIYRDNVRIQTQYVDRKLVVEAMCDPDTVRITQTKSTYDATLQKIRGRSINVDNPQEENPKNK